MRKNFILMGILICNLNFYYFAQSSIHLVTTNAAGTSTISVIGNGGGYTVTTSPNTTDIPARFRFYNTDATNTYTYNILRTIKVLNTQGTFTAETYFCAGATCLPPTANTLSSGDYIILTPGNSERIITYFNEINPIGYSEVYYKIFNVNNPNDTLGFTIYYNPSLNSVSENNSIVEDISIYPIPAKENIFIHLKSHFPLDATLSITNILGQTVLKQQVKIKDGFNSKTLDVSSLPNGVYFVLLNSTNYSKTFTQKIIINR